jgi:hypothetical protein
MTANFVFLIRPLSVQKGFELQCEGVLREPMRVQRLFEAILAAAQIGQDLDAEVRIYNTSGEIAEVLELNRSKTRELMAA